MTRLSRSGVLVATLIVSACGGDSPTSPTPNQNPTPPPTATLYTVTGLVSSAAGGAIAGATVRVADGPNAGLSTGTDGSGRYNLAGLTFAGFTVNVSAPNFVNASRGASLTAGQTTSTMNFSLLPATPWSRSGTGATVFDMPSYFSRVRVQATYGGRCENFVIDVGGRLMVNEILGTCSIASGPRYDGVHLTSGGVVQVRLSSGVNWSLTEQR